MNDRRKINADAAFAAYDMGDMIVKDTCPWQDLGDEWGCVFFVENGDEPSIRMVFVVKFEKGSSEVKDAYIGG